MDVFADDGFDEDEGGDTQEIDVDLDGTTLIDIQLFQSEFVITTCAAFSYILLVTVHMNR